MRIKDLAPKVWRELDGYNYSAVDLAKLLGVRKARINLAIAALRKDHATLRIVAWRRQSGPPIPVYGRSTLRDAPRPAPLFPEKHGTPKRSALTYAVRVLGTEPAAFFVRDDGGTLVFAQDSAAVLPRNEAVALRSKLTAAGYVIELIYMGRQ